MINILIINIYILASFVIKMNTKPSKRKIDKTIEYTHNRIIKFLEESSLSEKLSVIEQIIFLEEKRIKIDVPCSIIFKTNDHLALIFSFCDLNTLFDIVPLVCKQWNKFLKSDYNNFWKNYCIKKFPSLIQLKTEDKMIWKRWLHYHRTRNRMFQFMKTEVRGFMMYESDQVRIRLNDVRKLECEALNDLELSKRCLGSLNEEDKKEDKIEFIQNLSRDRCVPFGKESVYLYLSLDGTLYLIMRSSGYQYPCSGDEEDDDERELYHTFSCYKFGKKKVTVDCHYDFQINCQARSHGLKKFLRFIGFDEWIKTISQRGRISILLYLFGGQWRYRVVP